MAISSLGAGSGVLTSTIIDQLKAADTAAIITPITNKITAEQQKANGLSLISSLLTTFQASASSLGDSTLYQNRTVSGNTASVSVTANAGVAVQSFSITNTLMALNDVKESGSFSSASSTVASGAGTMSLSVGGLAYNINYSAGETLSSLADSINNVAGSSVKASTLQVGTNDYRLVLTSTQTGAAQSITLSDSTGGSLDTKLLAYNATTNPTGMQSIQAARDASFNYNGIAMTRSTNTITDIAPGMTVNLLQDNGSANISITQDTTKISDAMNSFVTSYNALTSQLTSMTTSDSTTGTVGIFNGDNSINAITRDINQIVTSMSNNGLSLPQFGIDLSQTGTMSFNSSTFLSAYNANPSASEAFFSNSTDGLFTSMNTMLTSYTGTNGIMSTLTDGSATQLQSLQDNQKSAQALLDARYTAMTAQFVQYDTIMTNLTNQFASLKQQINSTGTTTG
ncbi:flagellar filament capping protein FliD [Sulfuricurvum sp.]|uniref:flagellar filament capping protein FliD n=1 Tax=Sulfuricurvum sp. TaxID=2025608 RepID=UPI00356229BE